MKELTQKANDLKLDQQDPQLKSKLAELMEHNKNTSPMGADKLDQKFNKIEKQVAQAEKEQQNSRVLQDSLNKKEGLEKSRSEPEFNLQEKLLKYARVIILLIAILLAYYFLNKKKIKKIESPHDELIPELKSEWKQALRLKLSPNQEVIHFYNLFQKTLHSLKYTPAEAPPSCIIFQDLTESNPELIKANFALTEIFAQCFYGKKNINDKNLKVFRSALQKLLKIYGLV